MYCVLLCSSGIDTHLYPYIERRLELLEPIIVMSGRLLEQKGIYIFLEIARRFKSHAINAKFLWAGESDLNHPFSVSPEVFNGLDNCHHVGHLESVLPFLHSAAVMLFTSHYGEGVPRSLLEACSTGLPAIGFNVNGVKEVIIHNGNGFLVNPFPIITNKSSNK